MVLPTYSISPNCFKAIWIVYYILSTLFLLYHLIKSTIYVEVTGIYEDNTLTLSRMVCGLMIVLFLVSIYIFYLGWQEQKDIIAASIIFMFF